MKIHIYAKSNEDLSQFENILELIADKNSELLLSIENRRLYRKLEDIKKDGNADIVVVSSLSSLGLNDADIATQLEWFVREPVILIICDISSTYEFGTVQPTNQAVLSTVLQSVLSGNRHVGTVNFKKTNSGRAKLPFPDNWDELYAIWESKEISSKEFIEKTGLKKATFYNLMTEYKTMTEANEQYLKKYKIV